MIFVFGLISLVSSSPCPYDLALEVTPASGLRLKVDDTAILMTAEGNPIYKPSAGNTFELNVIVRNNGAQEVSLCESNSPWKKLIDTDFFAEDST